MQQRQKYLYSDLGGKMESEYLALKKVVQASITFIDTQLIDGTPSSDLILSEAIETGDNEQRRNSRRDYINNVKQWLNSVKVNVNKKTKSSKQKSLSKSGADEKLINTNLLSASDADIDPDTKNTVNNAIKETKTLLARMEEARQSERYLEVDEIRIDRTNGQVKLSSLTYSNTAGAYQLDEDKEGHNNTAPDFKIVTGGRRLKDHDDVVINITQEEYNALQELGATANRETTLMAKLINVYGQYRREILNNVIRFQIKTDTFVVKEQIIEQAIARLRMLQIIERAHSHAGQAEAANHIQTYYNTVNTLLTAEDQKQQELCKSLAQAIKEKNAQQIELYKWQIDVNANHIKGLQNDLAETTTLLKKPAEQLTEKTIALWLTKQAEHVIESGKVSAELVDISGKKGISKGYFSDITASAFELARTFDFPPNRKIMPAHQGIFDPNNEGHQLVLNSADLASGERSTRNVLFAFACVKSGFRNGNQLSSIADESNANTVLSRGFSRIAQSVKRKKTRNVRNINIEVKEKLTLPDTIWKTYYLLRDNVRSMNETFLHASKKVFSDAGNALVDTAIGAADEVAEVSIKFAKNVKRDFAYGEVKVEEKHAEEKIPAIKPISDDNASVIQEKYPEFKQWNPSTFYSVIDNFALQFGGFFIKSYESAPIIWTMASLIGGFSGAAAVAGPGIKAALMQLGCSEGLANGFVSVSQAISTATTTNPMFQVVGTGSTMQQGVYAVLDAMAGGADSMTAKAITEVKRNLPIVICVFAGATLGGMGLSQIEMLHKELGSVPVIAEFFTGLKFAGFGYEAVEHEPGEKSAVANSAASLMNLVFNSIRAAASFSQFAVAAYKRGTGHSDEAVQALTNFLRPWADLCDTTLRFAVSTADAALRTSTTLARGGKAVVKAALETPVNIAAKSLRLIGAEDLSKSIIKGKSTVGSAVDDNLQRPLHDVTRTVRNGYAQLMTQDDLYLGKQPAMRPVNFAHSRHSFCQVIKKMNVEATKDVVDAESNDSGHIYTL